MKTWRWLLLTLLVLSLLLTTFVACDTKTTETEEEEEQTTVVEDNTTTLTACEHTWSDWEMSKTPLCTAGYKTHTCSTCKKTEQEFVAPVDHKLIAIEVQEADAEEITASFCCEYCNALLLKTVAVDGDEDSDGLKNSVEITIGTNPFAADTDNDGIDDAREVSETNTDPTLADTDGDGLSDLEEIETHNTDPLLADTDGDGVVDGKEVEMGFDPLAAQTSFTVSYAPTFTAGESTAVMPSIDAELTPEQINSLKIERSDVVSAESVGYMGDAFDFSVDEESVENATVSLTVGFEYDESTVSGTAQPTIYAIEENEYGIKHMTPVATNVSNGKATALVDKFTTYVLVDRTVLEQDLTWIDTHAIDKNFDKLEIVFVIDDSGSMTSNDYNNQRLTVAKNLIDELPTGTKIGIVKFANSTTTYTSTLTTDKDVAKGYLTTNYFYSSGGTEMYGGINDSFSLFESTDDDTMRMMVVLTDGVANSFNSHSSTITTANNKKVNLYTIGLGSSSSSYFNSYLKPLAENTDGEFYLANDASNLADAFDAIGEKLSLTTDGDGDGLSDYYEENTVLFSGVNYTLDKTNPDTDGDGLLDGEEIVTTIIYSADGKKMSVTGVVKSNPSMKDSDGDGVNDKYDLYPMDPTR